MEMVGEQGFQRVSILSVARRADITRPIVYEHFGSLHGLLDALVKREMARALSQVSETALADLGEGDPSELMLESLRTYLAAVENHPTTWRLVLTPPEGAPALLRKRIARGRTEVLKSMTDAVSPGSLPGDLSEDPELTARILSAMADEYARLVLSDPKRFPPARLLEHARWWLGQVAGGP
jgi:AcrR family transcriptional regulator